MKKSRFSEHQIIKILKEVEAGRTAKKVCREYGISNATYYSWKNKFGGMEASDLRRMRELEYENARLKQMFADLSLENRALKDVIEKSSEASREARISLLPSRRVWFEHHEDLHRVAAGAAKPIRLLLGTICRWLWRYLSWSKPTLAMGFQSILQYCDVKDIIGIISGYTEFTVN